MKNDHTFPRRMSRTFRGTALSLAIVFGFLAIHDFYFAKPGSGVLLSLVEVAVEEAEHEGGNLSQEDGVWHADVIKAMPQQATIAEHVSDVSVHLDVDMADEMEAVRKEFSIANNGEVTQEEARHHLEQASELLKKLENKLKARLREPILLGRIVPPTKRTWEELDSNLEKLSDSVEQLKSTVGWQDRKITSNLDEDEEKLRSAIELTTSSCVFGRLVHLYLVTVQADPSPGFFEARDAFVALQKNSYSIAGELLAYVKDPVVKESIETYRASMLRRLRRFDS